MTPIETMLIIIELLLITVMILILIPAAILLNEFFKTRKLEQKSEGKGERGSGL